MTAAVASVLQSLVFDCRALQGIGPFPRPRRRGPPRRSGPARGR